MTKKLRLALFLLLFLATLLIALPATAQAATSGSCGDALKYTLSDDGTLTITGTGAMTDYQATGTTAPWLGEHTDRIDAMIISEGVTSIGSWAFTQCPSLTRISISSSVHTIGEGAFSDCDALWHVLYAGTGDQLTVGDANEALLSAVWHYSTTADAIVSPDQIICKEKVLHSCTVCGDSYTDTPVEATGHSYDEAVTAPTCTEGGFTTHTCAACGDSYADSPTDPTGHIYVDGKCVCGKVSLTAPSISNCFSRTQTTVKVTWSPVPGADGYQIWMQDSTGQWKIVKSILDGSTSYTKYDLESGMEYRFKVRSYTDVDGKKTFSAYSQEIAVTIG